jgi:hypothetical protein
MSSKLEELMLPSYPLMGPEVEAAARFTPICETIQCTAVSTSSEHVDAVALEAGEEEAIGLITSTVLSYAGVRAR